MRSYLVQFLSENRYRIIDHGVKRKDKFDLLDDYSKLDVPGAQGYLDVAPFEIGYLYEPDLVGAKIKPVATVIVRLVTAKDQQVIYARIYQYGYQVNVPSQSEQLFPRKATFTSRKTISIAPGHGPRQDTAGHWRS